MPRSRTLSFALAAAGVVLLCAHPLLNFRYPRSADAITDGFYIFWTLAAFAACVVRSIRVPAMRRSWVLVSCSFLLWGFATIASAWSEFIAHASLRSATIDDFFYFFYGVPILLAIAAPEESESASLFFWLDGVQSAGLGFLAYVAFFNAIPFSGARLHPITVERLVWVFDAENVLLALLATARLAVSSRRSHERRLLQILCAFLWTYAVCAGINNHLFALYSLSMPVDFVIDAAFALLVFATLLVPFAEKSRPQPRDRKPMARLLDNGRHILLGLSLVLLAAYIAYDELNIAIGAVLAAFVLYGIRSAYLQSRYQQTQMELEDARDRLEKIALQDGLTRVANRRCFDQRLALEWGRADRNRQPLSLLLIDIDRFKKVNDTYGHLVGDDCLVVVAQAFRAALNRPGDLLARYGGEEFVALLPATDAAGSVHVADRLQLALRNSEPAAALDSQVTVSIGACTYAASGSGSAHDLVQCADRALYMAKQNGRNRIEILPFTVE